MRNTIRASAFAQRTDQVTADELRALGSVKWTTGDADVIGAFIAEMDFGAAPAIETALRDSVARAQFGYLTDQDAAEMGQACADWQRDRYGWDVPPERIRPVPDVLKALEAAITVFSRPGSPVILPTPAYMPFLILPGRLGREIIQVPMASASTPDGDRDVLDLEGIDAAFKAGGHLLVLCNPANPVGRVYTREELAALSEVVERNSGRVFADEIHAPLIYPGGRHVPYASLSPETAGHTVTGTAASKGWNLPGLKCAQLILGNDADAATWSSGSGPLVYEHGTSTVGVRATTAAYSGGGDWLADVTDYLHGSRDLLTRLLAEHLPDAGFRPPEGTYLAWLDCRPLGLADVAADVGKDTETAGPRDTAHPGGPAGFFLDKARVLLNDGATCGDAGRGHVRLNFATPRPILTEIIERMADAVRL